jgi:hypothetical protein
MKFNEFKNPQLTEEQIVLAYCKGEITKEDAVSQLSEMDWRDIANNLTWGGIDSRAEQDAQDKAGYGFSDELKSRFAIPGTKMDQEVKAKRAAAAAQGIKSSSDALASAPGASPLSAIKNLTGWDFGANSAQAAPTKVPTQYANRSQDDDSGMDTPTGTTDKCSNRSQGDDSGRRTPAPTPAPTQRPKVAATAYNTRDYDKTLALQKKLIAQGANIKADGLMGPNTMAAMKAFKNTNPATGGMGPGGAGGVAKPKATGTGMKSTITPGSKVKMPGPSVTQNPAYNQTGMDDIDMEKPQPKTPGPSVTQNPAYNQTGMDDIDMEKPKPKMPKAFGIGPRVDDPKGGETVKTPFGFSYKTLPQNPNEFDDRN